MVNVAPDAAVFLTNEANVSMPGEVVRANNATADGVVVLRAPATIDATGFGTTVGVSWSVVIGAARYDLYRSSNNEPFAFAGTTTTNFLNDPLRAPNTNYLYRVRAFDATGKAGPFSAIDPAITTVFTDDPIVQFATIVKEAHMIELRTAINGLRVAAGLLPANFTAGSLAGTLVLAVHVTELRAALDQARSPS